ncbi:hypothetical protein [Streptomyces sp. 8L]|uniref:hypothetical protein n=1 Tax=Streptomyces sp. 8L TaxID=2877242 RepID=UPI001CD6F304|nr:hypothetical protein [Streptomyces sp. 8L]MCA1223833.1 hypothetical protein [Streptomyces sp. 8L]
MDIFVTVIALLVLFALVLAAPVTWWLKDRAVDRQLREAERFRDQGRTPTVATRWAEPHRAARSQDAWTLTHGGDRH